MTASKVKYMMDADTILRDTGVAAITATASTAGVALPRSSGLEGHVDGMASGRFAVVLVLGARTTGGASEETYVFSVEVDDDNGFATNLGTIGSVTIAASETAAVRTILIDDDDIDALGNAPAFVRVTATLGGTAPSVVYSAYISPIAGS